MKKSHNLALRYSFKHFTMSYTKIFDKEFAEIYYSKETLIVKVIWKDYPYSMENYQEVFLTCLDFQVNNKAIYFMTDTRNQSVVSPEKRKWFETEAMPRAVKQGLIKGCVLTDSNIFKKYYINNILDTTKKFGLPFKAFSSEEEATKWLLGG